MWARAAKELAKFPSAVVTAVGVGGYPVSVRVPTSRYNAGTGELPVVWPAELPVAAGPAVVLCHYHDEKLWNITTMQIKGRMEQRGGGWAFVSTGFTPPAPMLIAFLQWARTSRAVGARYLAKRHLAKPKVNWDAVAQIRDRARQARL